MSTPSADDTLRASPFASTARPLSPRPPIGTPRLAPNTAAAAAVNTAALSSGETAGPQRQTLPAAPRRRDRHDRHERRNPAIAGSAQELDLRTTLQRVRRVLRLDPTVLAEVRDDPQQTLTAVLLTATALLLAGVGGAVWLLTAVDGVSTGRVLLRELFLGSVLALGAWALWVLATHAVLVRAQGHAVRLDTLVRPMGFAGVAGGGALLMFLPALSLATGLLALVAWFALSQAAVESALQGAAPETAPDAARSATLRRDAALANATGFVLFVVLLSLLAEAAGMAPGIFAHAGDLSAFL